MSLWDRIHREGEPPVPLDGVFCFGKAASFDEFLRAMVIAGQEDGWMRLVLGNTEATTLATLDNKKKP